MASRGVLVADGLFLVVGSVFCLPEVFFWLPAVFFWLPAGCFLLPTGCCPALSAQNKPPEHKIGVFVLFWPSEPSFSSLSSTKSMFLCSFAFRNPRFRAFRAQNRGFCALSPILWAPYRYESNAETLSPQQKNNIIICIVISCQYLGVVLQRVNYGGSILCLLFYFSLHWR